MKKFSKPIKSLLKLWTILIIAVMLISCEESGIIEIVPCSPDSFPVISIQNPGGKNITFQPVSSDTGSIGFEIEGVISWITGMPDIKPLIDNQQSFSFNSGTGEHVILTAGRSFDDISIQLRLEKSGVPLEPTRWFFNLGASEDEYFTGIFERVIDGPQSFSWKDDISTSLNLRNEHVDMHLKPTVSAYAPFYVSSAKYGLFVKGSWPGTFDFCKASPEIVQVNFEGPELDFKFYLNNSPLKVIQKHALETGPSFVPPLWAFGMWRWRDEHFTKSEYYDGTPVRAPYNADLVEDILMMKAFDIPFSAYWIDRPWGPGSRGFDDYLWNTRQFPEPEKMIQWLNKNNIELMMWIGPFVMGEMADYAEDHDYYLKSRMLKNSRQVLMDFTNPEACKWWGENGPGKLAKMGVKGFKLDRADGEKLLDSLHLITHAGTTYRENFNDYAHQYVKATYEAVRDVLDTDFILFPRAQYTGSSRYGGLWAGDTSGKQEGLRSAIIGMQRCAVMGYPVWGSDIGGYSGEFSSETTKRWLAFGCFSPIMETGPTKNRGFWNCITEPSYDTELIATWRLYSKIRTGLISYLHSLAVEASTTGTPIARPLFLDYPEEPEAWDDWQTYKLGPDILVSAVWKKGTTSQKIYLPKGDSWIDAWDPEKEYKGGTYIVVETPAYKIPVFLRKGSSLTFPDLNKLYQESLEIARQKPDLKKLEEREEW